MNKIIFLIILLTGVVGFCQELPWQAARAKPLGYLKLKEAKAAMKLEQQISCQHLSFRYKELDKIVKDISWISTTSAGPGQNKWEAHEYIQARLHADPRPIAETNAYHLKFSLSELQLSAEVNPVEAIALLGAVRFDLAFPKSSKNKIFNIEESDKELNITTSVNTFDVCSKKYLEVFLLRGCPKNETEAFQCGDKACDPSLTYDWQACTDVQVYRVSLKGFENKLGLRKREIKRSL